MGLNLSDIPDRTVIYVDANIFLFSAFKHPLYGDVCKEFLMRMEGYACTSDYSLNEVFHKLMIAETSKKFVIKPKEVVFFITVISVNHFDGGSDGKLQHNALFQALLPFLSRTHNLMLHICRMHKAICCGTGEKEY